MDYESRLETLKRHRIGLWDVFKAGNREGSEDAKIKRRRNKSIFNTERNGSKAKTGLFQWQKIRKIRTNSKENGV